MWKKDVENVENYQKILKGDGDFLEMPRPPSEKEENHV